MLMMLIKGTDALTDAPMAKEWVSEWMRWTVSKWGRHGYAPPILSVFLSSEMCSHDCQATDPHCMLLKRMIETWSIDEQTISL